MWLGIDSRTRRYMWVEFCCWFSSLFREVFLRVLRFSLLLKNQHFRILIRSRFQWTNSHYVEVPLQIPQFQFQFQISNSINYWDKLCTMKRWRKPEILPCKAKSERPVPSGTAAAHDVTAAILESLRKNHAANGQSGIWARVATWKASTHWPVSIK